MTDELVNIKLAMRDETKDRLKASVRPIAGAALGTGTAYAVHDLARRGVERHLAKSVGPEAARRAMRDFARKSAPIALASGALLVPALDMAVRHAINEEKAKGIKKQAIGATGIGALAGGAIGAIGGGIQGYRNSEPGGDALRSALHGAGTGAILGSVGGAVAGRGGAQTVKSIQAVRQAPGYAGSTIGSKAGQLIDGVSTRGISNALGGAGAVAVTPSLGGLAGRISAQTPASGSTVPGGRR